jgi:uncharacterized paraquat-inducible protein A
MQALTRLVAMVLVLTLGGGAQACLASCATPVHATKPACHRCEKPKDKTPEAPCQRCQLAGQDRATADNHQVTIPTPTLAFAPTIIQQPLPIHRSITTPREPTHGPPGDLFHQFCLLLI